MIRNIKLLKPGQLFTYNNHVYRVIRHKNFYAVPCEECCGEAKRMRLKRPCYPKDSTNFLAHDHICCRLPVYCYPKLVK